jgi:hypothetical protein
MSRQLTFLKLSIDALLFNNFSISQCFESAHKLAQLQGYGENPASGINA